MSDVLDLTLMGESFITLFVIMDPPGAIPLFLSLTQGRSQAQRRKAAWQATVVALAVIVAFALFGRQILSYLHITLPALQCAGGLLLLLVALELLTGREQDLSASRDVNVALVPLGTPLLAGPGAIVATMVFAERVHDVADFVALAGGVIGVHVVLWLTLRYSTLIVRLIHESGILLVTRISGLLLSAIAVQLIADSVRAFIAADS
ncbi:MAG TPA: MarC family protein [Nocardioidaceae bacterium]|nr:MarC family protein [Nocardioidaceae bacterium]